MPLELSTPFKMENPYRALPCLSDQQDSWKTSRPFLDGVDVRRASQGLRGAVECLT